MTVDVIPSNDQEELLTEIKNLTEKINSLETFIQQKFVSYEERINERDKMLMQALRSSLEVRQAQIEAAAAMNEHTIEERIGKSKKKWWHFFSN